MFVEMITVSVTVGSIHDSAKLVKDFKWCNHTYKVDVDTELKGRVRTVVTVALQHFYPMNRIGY